MGPHNARVWIGGVLGVAGALAASCVNLGPFSCTEDEQCRDGGVAGICAAPGHCALPDASCSSGFSYHERSPDALVGQCVPDGDPGTGSDATTAGDSSGGASSGEAGDTSAGSTSTSGTPMESSGSDSGGTGVLCGDRPCACAVEIAAGADHSCAIRDDGSVVCWGGNGEGQLGLGETSQPVAWPEPVALPASVTASDLVLGDNAGCVMGSDAALYCWGQNESGGVQPGAEPASVTTPVVVDWVATGGPIGIGLHHSCVAAGDTLECFGDNNNNQITTTMGGPGPFTVPDALLPTIDEVALGATHSCARSGAEIACWGADNNGQLGNDMKAQGSSTPEAVQLTDDAELLTTGAAHVCAMVQQGQRLWCWGSNEHGQLGANSGFFDVELPVQSPLVFDDPVRSMHSRADSSCVMTDGGALWCWGRNEADKYGTGNDSESLPVLVPIVDELPEAVVTVALGRSHMCVISEGGHVWCWGADESAQLGPADPRLGSRAVEVDLRCPQ